MEVTGINRQSYMAEVSQLLELITDGETRERLIAQMEQMFDAAEDEQALIEQIGSPTKVAVALIRFADNKKAEAKADAPAEPEPEVLPEPEPVVVPEPVAAPEPVAEAPVEEAVGTDEEEFPESAYDEELPDGAYDDDVMPESAYDEELPVSNYDEEALIYEEVSEAEAVPVEEPAAADELLAEIESVVMQETGEAEAPVEEADPIEAAFETAFSEPETVAEEVEEAAEATEEEAFQAEAEAEAANVPDLAEALRRADESDGADSFEAGEAAEDDNLEPEPTTRTRVIGWRVFLYLLIPGIVIGLPIFLALFAISLVLLAVSVAAVAAAVGVISSAFVGFTVVADLLLVLGAGLSVFAIAFVLLWFAIWFLIKVTFGWVRLITRGGVRFTRKEVPVE